MSLADLAETAARLCKADLVTGMVGEFPELQGIMGGYYASAQGLPPQVAVSIRDHYKPVGQGDDVPTAPVTVAVGLADKLDTLVAFFIGAEQPTGSKDPFALRRAALGVVSLILRNRLRLSLVQAAFAAYWEFRRTVIDQIHRDKFVDFLTGSKNLPEAPRIELIQHIWQSRQSRIEVASDEEMRAIFWNMKSLQTFFADRLKVQQREAGVRHDLIDAVFALGGEDDLVRLLARVKALQAFVETAEGRDLLAGYKRAANILKKEGWTPSERHPELVSGQGSSHADGETSLVPNQVRDDGAGQDADDQGIPQTGEEDPFVMAEDLRDALAPQKSLSFTPEPAEQSLIAALDAAEPRARSAVAAEDFGGAMAALASLRGPVDAFFESVTVNDADAAKRAARLDLLARMRDAVHQVADFSRIDG